MARNALLLSLGGAPNTWHTVTGVGLLHPLKPVLVGDIEQAKSWHDDPGCPVELVTASKAQLEASERELQEMRGQLLRAIRTERDIAPLEQVEAAMDAVRAGQ